PEIAERLTLASSSVKSHMQHVYGKLRASSKREAVARARELGWLPAAAGASPAPHAERPLAPAPTIGAVQPYPTGTLTFLFAGLEGQPRPATLRTAPARPTAMLRQGLERHGGYIFRAWGDQLCAAFDTAEQAVSAAMAA